MDELIFSVGSSINLGYLVDESTFSPGSSMIMPDIMEEISFVTVSSRKMAVFMDEFYKEKSLQELIILYIIKKSGQKDIKNRKI